MTRDELIEVRVILEDEEGTALATFHYARYLDPGDVVELRIAAYPIAKITDGGE